MSEPLVNLKKSYSSVGKILSKYWRIYGGTRSLLLSPYLHISVLLLTLTFGTWSSPDWWSQVFSILPNLIGFSLGGLAIFLGVGSDRFREMISGKEPGEEDDDSPFIEATVTFTHFILVQVLALILALILSGLAMKELLCVLPICVATNNVARIVLWGSAYLVFLYAIALAFGTTLSLFRIAGWFDDFMTRERKADGAKKV